MKTVLVTGGGRGIGAGIVEALAAESWNVVFCGRAGEENYKERCNELEEKYSIMAVYYSFDVSDTQKAPDLLHRILTEVGPLNALVNNAGVAPLARNDILDMTEESYDRVMNINLKGPFFLSQLIARYMIGEKKEYSDFPAVIVNIGSVSATAVSVNRGEYCLSKAGVAMMNSLFAVRLAEYGIPVYELRPGIVRSDMTAGVTEKYTKLISQGLTLQSRWGEPQDVGKAVAMLLRGDIAYSTGQVIGIDGGMTIQHF